MPTVNIHAAKTNLSKLIARACAGEEVIIARHNEPVVRLVPIESVSRKREPGTHQGRFTVPPSFFEPLPDHESAAWDQ